jgi:hypothetical protein
MSGIGLVTAMLESIVLLDCCRVGQVKHVTRFYQSTDQSVPVIGRLHNNAGQFMQIGLQRGADRD